MMVLIIILIIISVGIIYYIRKKNNIIHIPFKESMDLINLPVVTFINNGVKLHFLLDTGSDDSFITTSVVDKLKITTKHDKITNIQTGSGVISSMGMITLNINYLESSYENTFIISDLEAPFKHIADSRGIQIHGIIGSLFFRRYGYKLDFNKLSAYR